MDQSELWNLWAGIGTLTYRYLANNSVRYLGVKSDSKLNWKSHVSAIAKKLNRGNAVLYKVRDFANANILMHYLNHTLTMLASYGEKTLAQLTVSTFSTKMHLKVINLKERNAH